MDRLRSMVWLVLASAAVAAAGCAHEQARRREVKPADFAAAHVPTAKPKAKPDAASIDPISGDTTPVAVGVATPSSPANPDHAPDPTAPVPAVSARSSHSDDERAIKKAEQLLDKAPRPQVVASTTAAAAGDNTFTVDAMVGQVNGQALYASKVFEPINDALAQLGKSLPRVVFRRRAVALIDSRLKGILFDALILGEAERDLSEQEQAGLKNVLQDYREELLRQFGEMSPAKADFVLMQKEGKTLEQKVREQRQKLIVQRYMSRKLLPKINVTRKDIERYYRDHEKEYNQPRSRSIRLIKVKGDDAAGADRIAKRLADRVPFAEVAHDPSNVYRASDGGLFGGGKVVGDEVFGTDALNAALVKLEAGKYSPRIEADGATWWVFVESIEGGQSRSLREVQLEIERTLRYQRYGLLSSRYRDRLVREGEFTPLDDMARALLDVAMSRYAQAN
jgi:PPIC-type PPIASE domain